MADEPTSATGDQAEVIPENAPLPEAETPAGSSEQQPLFEQRAPLDVPEVVTAAEAEQSASDPAGSAEPLADTADEMPDDLRELADRLEQPTGEMAAVVVGQDEPSAELQPAADADEAEAEPESGDEAVAEAGEMPGAEAGAEAGEAAGAEAGEAAVAEASAEAAPEAVTAGEAEAQVAVDQAALPRTSVSWWPFVGYVVVWLGAAAYAVWQLQLLPAGQVAYETNLYMMSMAGGLMLLVAGPVLILVVWLASWIGRKGRRIGLMFISALVKGAAATMLGALIWIAAILITDYLRLGRPF